MVQATPEAGLVALFKIVRFSQALSPSSAMDIGTLRTLVIVAEQGPCRASDAAAELCLDLSTVSRQLNSLEKQRYVRKTEDPDDGRASLIEITDEGQQLLQELIQTRLKAISPALDKWSNRDREQFFKLLIRLADDLREQIELSNA